MKNRPPSPRFWTLDEANAMLPRLAPLLDDMRGQAQALEEAQEELAQMKRTVHSNGNAVHAETLARQVADLQQTLRAGMEQIQEWGIELKDLGQGLIDFPHRRGGRVVYLCWRLGEEQIGWWHEIQAGFAGRQPIDTL
jgi:hypothetical protein